MARIEKLREEWTPRLEFTYVYIKEAHPEDEWQAPKNVESEVIFKQPTNFVERMELAETFVEANDVGTRTLVDDMTNKANACYAAWPERIYVIDQDGTIAYKGGMGPFKFKPKDLGEFLQDRYSHLAPEITELQQPS